MDSIKKIAEHKIPDEFLVTIKFEDKELTGYKGQYLIDFLNQEKIPWSSDSNLIYCNQVRVGRNEDFFVSVKCKLTIDGISRDGFGGSVSSDVDFAFKAAATKAFKNAARYFGFGGYLYYDYNDDILDASLSRSATAVAPVYNNDTAADISEMIKQADNLDGLDHIPKLINEIDESRETKNLLIKEFNNKKLSLMK